VRSNPYNRVFAAVVLFVAQEIVVQHREMILVYGVRRNENEKERRGTFLIIVCYNSKLEMLC
jgi:hypothetical protein